MVLIVATLNGMSNLVEKILELLGLKLVPVKVKVK